MKVSVVFLIGISHQDLSDEQQFEINYENEVYGKFYELFYVYNNFIILLGDIIQENFVDSYNNLTLKSILMLKWVNNNCIDKGTYIFFLKNICDIF